MFEGFLELGLGVGEGGFLLGVFVGRGFWGWFFFGSGFEGMVLLGFLFWWALFFGHLGLRGLRFLRMAFTVLLSEGLKAGFLCGFYAYD